jgi:putative RNA 2'-phosphotransferase
MKPELVSKSKFLSLVLRHKPEEIGLTLDPNGWADVHELLIRSKMDLQTLEEIVATNEKKRFAFNEDKTKIRASQGHSIEVDLQYKPAVPPSVLYHGTALRFLDSIMKTGLEKKGRQHVHLSKDTKTALDVGKRHGQPAVLEVDSKEMLARGHKFYLSDNGVWLTDNVPTMFLSHIDIIHHQNAFKMARDAFAALTDYERSEIVQDYCQACWSKDLHCQCDNEE